MPPPPPGQTFWGALGGGLPQTRLRWATWRFQGDAGAAGIGRVPAGGRERKERRDRSPQKRERHPLSGSRGFPARHSPCRCSGDPSAAGAPSRWLVQCPGHSVFPQRRPRHSSASPPLPFATCGLSEPREGAGAAESREPCTVDRSDDPFSAVGLAPAGHLPCRYTD